MKQISYWSFIVCLIISVLSAGVSADSVQTPEGRARIVAVGGAITEIIYALDGQDLLAGVDTTSLWPDAAKNLPQVGYMRSLSAEGILSLAPTLMLASAHAGPPRVLDQIRGADVPVTILPESYSLDGIIHKIATVAAALDKTEEGKGIVSGIQADFSQVELAKQKLKQPPRVLFVLTIAQGAPLVSGQATPANAMIQLAGGKNAVDGFEGNKPMASESIIAAAPDIILLTDLTVKAAGGLEKFEQLSGFNQTPAVKHGRIIVMDTLYLLGFGPRTGKAALELSARLESAMAMTR